MAWKKLGRVFCPNAEDEWMQTHAANPTALPLGRDIFRVYFSTRDRQRRSSIAWVEIDINQPTTVLQISKEPALQPGLLGCFDDSGCSIGCIVQTQEALLMYYMGWNLGVTVPWRNAIGLAQSHDGGLSFQRVSLAPVMDRADADPYTLSYPWVLKAGDEWQMWYGSNLQWGKEQADMFHMLKYAHSTDGYVWHRDGKVIVHPINANEYAFARPCVVKEEGLYRLWYAYRGEAYRIGYAESADGRAWVRKDSGAGIAPTPGEWDGEAIEYPSVFDHQGNRYLLYCGNGYGLTGFGIAVWE